MKVVFTVTDKQGYNEAWKEYKSNNLELVKNDPAALAVKPEHWKLKSGQEEVCVVARVDGKVVGVQGAYINENRKTGNEKQMWVCENYRGLRIAPIMKLITDLELRVLAPKLRTTTRCVETTYKIYTRTYGLKGTEQKFKSKSGQKRYFVAIPPTLDFKGMLEDTIKGVDYEVEIEWRDYKEN